MENTLLRVETNLTLSIIFLKSVQKNELKFCASVINAFKNRSLNFQDIPGSLCMYYIKASYSFSYVSCLLGSTGNWQQKSLYFISVNGFLYAKLSEFQHTLLKHYALHE